MPLLFDVLLNAPIPIATVALLLRYGPSALLAVIAGVVAVLATDERGERALAVLRLVRDSPARRTHPSVRPHGRRT